ncbi:MAG: NADH:flavin oxidoreductase [Desulfarculaceae bacterium]|jgi:2,4-dienoyl-CoA reductase (NADPH2)
MDGEKVMTAFAELFSPLSLGAVELANRITMAPLYTGYADQKGEVTPLMLSHYQEMGASGAALVVVENAAVSVQGMGSPFTLRVDDDRFLAGLSRLARSLKQGGALAGLQINHAGRFAFSQEPVAPSPVAAGKKVPHELSQEAMAAITQDFAQAASRVRQAGFDLVELHGGTGYLLSQFVSPRTNLRSDDYGGPMQARLRFPLEVITAVREAVGPDYPIGYRFLADEWLPQGLRLEQSLEAAPVLALAGLAYLSVMGGTYESFFLPEIKEQDRRPGYMTGLAEAVKKTVSIPVIAAGRIQTPEMAEELLVQGKTDLIGLARVLLADPEWPRKAREGRAPEITACEPHCRLCWERALKGRPMICSQWTREKRERVDAAG